MTEEEHKPCPFQGCMEITARYDDYDNWYVYCSLCDIMGPSADSEEEGWRLWNQRWTSSE